jgi:hypothetical protein
MAKDQDWISTTEAAEIMGVSARTVRNYVALKIMEHRRTMGVYKVLRSEATAMAHYSNPLDKAASLVALAKTYAAAAKFPPGRFNELLSALNNGKSGELRESAEAKRSRTAAQDIDSILG